MTFKNLTMTMERPRSILEVLRDSDWIDGAAKIIINLDEELISDFTGTGSTGEILDRLYADEIDYIGWGTNVNNAQNLEFLNKYDENGILVNMDALLYAQQIQAIADEIYKQYWFPDVSTFLIGDNTVLEAINGDISGTADAKWPGGKWRFYHRTTGFSNPLGIHPQSGQDISDLGSVKFNKPGYYDIYYKDKFVRTITAHRAPVASFNATLNGAAAPTLMSTATDPDDTANGIVSQKWSYIDLDGAAAVVAGKPGALTAGHVYLVKLEVTDKHGASDVTSKQLSYVSGSSPSEVKPPFADFDIAPKLVTDGSLTLTNKSYDLQGRPITSTFTLTSGGTTVAFPIIAGVNNLSSLPAGDYEITLVVNNGVHDSAAPIVRSFTVGAGGAGPLLAPPPPMLMMDSPPDEPDNGSWIHPGTCITNGSFVVK